MNKNKSVFLVGTRWFGVLGPCKLLIDELISRGFSVYVFGQEDAHYQQFEHGKVNLVKLNVRRSYYSFIFDILDICKLGYFIYKLQPDAIHSFNPKPSLICFFSLFGHARKKFFIGVTGLGNTFIRAKRLEPLIAKIISFAANRANFLFFQNPDDRQLFVEKLKVKPDKTRLFRSPGVDTDRFILKDLYPTGGKLKIILVARLIWQKGVDDFLAAYELIKQGENSEDYQFTLVGGL